MILSLTGYYRRVTFTNLSLYVTNEEDAFDQITSYVRLGLVLHDAKLISRGSQLSLPVAAFDGQPLDKPLEQLQQQWRQLLEAPGRIV